MSDPVLVTGGTGFLGEHVVRELVARGDREVRVLARSTAHGLEALGARVHLGDVVPRADGAPDPALVDALKGVKQLYHLAGMVSRDARDGQRMMRVHIDGTRAVLHAAKAAGVTRVLVSSSSGTIAVSKEPDVVADESAPYAVDLVGEWPYYLSKIYQEKLALSLGKSLGLEIVIVSPSLLLGPGDRRGSSTGDVKKFLRREIPVVPPGGINFVDARDAATATVAAMERAKDGARYLLGGPNWTMAEFFGRLGRIAKVRPPWLKLPDKAARWGAELMERAFRAAGREPRIDRISVEMSQHFWYCDSSKAMRELGFEPRDPADTLNDTVRDLRRRLEWDGADDGVAVG